MATTVGWLATMYCGPPTSTGWVVITCVGALRLFISLAIWHQEHRLQKVTYVQSPTMSPCAEKWNRKKLTDKNQKGSTLYIWTHLDAVAVTHCHSQGHGHSRDGCCITYVQHGETKTLSKLRGGGAGKAGTTPAGEAAWNEVYTGWMR